MNMQVWIGVMVAASFWSLLQPALDSADSMGKLSFIPAAFALALAIALQNFPEGAIVSMPLRAEGMPKTKTFWYGVLSVS
ncbi:MAG: hypothetical protein K5987_04245 [Lachnospiraceae bacterium]|nr:hypothetical protein [Lachnospiraceae bacterium]